MEGGGRKNGVDGKKGTDRIKCQKGDECARNEYGISSRKVDDMETVEARKGNGEYRAAVPREKAQHDRSAAPGHVGLGGAGARCDTGRNSGTAGLANS